MRWDHRTDVEGRLCVGARVVRLLELGVELRLFALTGEPAAVLLYVGEGGAEPSKVGPIYLPGPPLRGGTDRRVLHLADRLVARIEASQ